MAWQAHSYRRNAVDIHTEDWDEAFFSRFDAGEYVLVKTAQVQSVLFYTNAHTGLCLWPAECGDAHRSARERDIVREVIRECHREGIDAVLYYSTIFHDRAYDRHPEWRMLSADGTEPRQKLRGGDVLGWRYGVCCPNSGYRSFVFAQPDELCDRYPEADGFFLDMMFWPETCYCAHCRERFFREMGRVLPETVEWGAPEWESFQGKRQEWLREFAHEAAERIHTKRSVVYQFGVSCRPWGSGFTEEIAADCDYVGGDFYGELAQESFLCKYFHSISPQLPFEYITAACDDSLGEHTTYKTERQLAQHAFLSLAHDGAFMFVNPVEIDGTVHARLYETMGRFFARTRPYEPFCGGRLQYDVAVLFSQDSQMDIWDNGTPVASLRAFPQPHLDSSLAALAVLTSAHISVSVIGTGQIDRLLPGQVLVLSNLERASAEIRDALSVRRTGGFRSISAEQRTRHCWKRWRAAAVPKRTSKACAICVLRKTAAL